MEIHIPRGDQAPPQQATRSSHDDHPSSQIDEVEDRVRVIRPAFRGFAGSLAIDACGDSEADPVVVLLTTQTIIGAAIGRNKLLQVDAAFHAPGLYLGVVGRSGTGRKDESVKRV